MNVLKDMKSQEILPSETTLGPDRHTEPIVHGRREYIIKVELPALVLEALDDDCGDDSRNVVGETPLTHSTHGSFCFLFLLVS